MPIDVRFKLQNMSFITQPSLWTNTRNKSEHSTIHESKHVRSPVNIEGKWSKLLQQYRLSHLHQQEYPEVERGSAFFREFLKGEYLEKIPVEINLPSTLLMDDDENLFMLYKDKNRVSKKRVTLDQYQNEIRKENLKMLEQMGGASINEQTYTVKRKFHSIHKSNSGKVKEEMSSTYNFKYKPCIDFRKNPQVPYVLFRKNAADKAEIFEKEIINFKNFDEMKFTPRHQYIYQRYIFSRNLKAMIIRLCYHAPSSSSLQSDFAYRYQNKNQIFKYQTRLDIYETGVPLSTVSPTETQEYSFEVSKIVGKTLLPYQKMARSLSNYLQKVMPIRITKLYVDFIIDINEQIWLTNLKHIELGQATVLSSSNLSHSNITCTTYCKLCGMIHRRDEVSKTLTFKLLYELVEHLKKRTKKNQTAFEFLYSLKFNQNMNIPCQLCDVCYKLVVSQHQLIQVEKEMAKTMNIKVNDDVAIETVSAKNRKRPAYLAEDLHQWRLMIHLSELDKFTEDQTNMYIQYRINGSNSLGGCCKIQGYKELVALNFIKIHYLFSESLNIERLINDSELVVRLTNGLDWNKYIAQGSSGTVSHFKNNLEAGQRHSSTILIFDNSQHYCELRLTMGLVCDGVYNTSELNLHREKDIYLPDISYHNCNPLPKEWMEMFSPKYALKMMDLEQNTDTALNFGAISRTTQHQHLKTFFRKHPN